MSDSEDMSDEEYYNVFVRVRRVKMIRARPNHFNMWDDVDFRKRFRLCKQSAMQVLEEIRVKIQHPTNWNSAVTAECMFLLTLRFYASGGMLIAVGDFSGVSTSTACIVIKKVSHHIALLRRKYIRMPSTDEEKANNITDFFNTAKFPRTVAAMDCTHVRIQSPGGENAEIFRNRKGFFSYNVQTLCNNQLKILDIVTRWPGSAHDSTIFNNSRIRARFESGEFGNSVIVADGGYQCRNYVMTPLRTCSSPEEILYNESQIRTRNCVERSYGVWKRRFPILSTGMRLKTITNQSIVVATAVLHNICLSNNDLEAPPLDDFLEEQVNYVNSVESLLLATEEIVSTRAIFIENYFKNL